MKAILRKDNYVYVIGVRPVEITNQRWKENNYNAISNFHLLMVDVVLSSIVEKIIMKEILDTLIKLYEVKSLHTKIFLKKKLYTLRM